MKKIIFILSLFAGILNAQTNYFSKAAGSLELITTWGTNADGSGANPVNFTTANQVFNISNSNPGTIAANWTVSGASSKVVVTNANSFTINANTYTGTVDVNNGGTLNLINATVPTLGSLGATSTVVYGGAVSKTVKAATYGNLTISTSQHTTGANTIIISGNLVLNSNITFGNSSSITLNGVISGAGLIYGGGSGSTTLNPNFTYNGAGTTPFPGPGTARHFKNFTITSATGVVTLGNTITVNGILSNAGKISLNGKGLELGSSITTGVTVTGTGTIQGSGTMNIWGSNLGTIYMDQTTNTTKTLSGLNVFGNSNSTLGNNMIVSGTASFYDGSILNIGTNTLEFQSTINTFGSGTGKVSSGTTGTVIYNSSNNQVVAPFDYGNLTFQGTRTTHTITFATAANINVSHTVTNSATFTSGSVVATGSTVNFNGAATTVAGTAFSFNNVTISSGTFTSPAATLNVSGNFTNNATFSHNNGTVVLDGTTAQTISGNATAFNSMSVTSGASVTRTVTIGSNITIRNDLTLAGPATAGMLTFDTGLKLTLLSVSGQTARVATISNDTRVTLPSNFIIQRFYPGGTTDWCNMGSPGQTGLTFAAWDPYIAITCPACPDGSKVGGVTFTSVTNYNETVGGAYDNAARFQEIASINDPMTIGKGFWIYFGDGQPSTGDLTMVTTGPIQKGSLAMPLTLTGAANSDHGWNLPSNPYPSPLSWTSFRGGNANIDNEVQVYNPDIADYAIYAGGVSTPAVGAGGLGDAIPMGQSFNVHVTANVAVTATELMKTSSQNAILRTANPVQTVFRLAINGTGKNSDETVFHFNSNATRGWDTEMDAHKRLSTPKPNPAKPSITSVIDDTEYSVNALPVISEDLSIPLMVKTKTTGKYTISPKEIENLPADVCVILHDNITGYDQDLRKGSYTFTLESTTTTPRFNLNLLKTDCNSFSKTSAIAASNEVKIGQDASGAFVKFGYSEQTKTVISVTNLLGEKVMQDINADVTGDAVYLNLSGLGEQILIISVLSDNKRTVKKIFNQ